MFQMRFTIIFELTLKKKYVKRGKQFKYYYEIGVKP